MAKLGLAVGLLLLIIISEKCLFVAKRTMIDRTSFLSRIFKSLQVLQLLLLCLTM